MNVDVSRSVFLPSGQWFDYSDGKTKYERSNEIVYKSELDKIPVFIRAGAIIPTSPIMQYSLEMPLSPLTLEVYPGRDASSFTLFEDDGEYGYDWGVYATTQYECIDKNGTVTITINARHSHGGYDSGRRKYIVNVHGRPAYEYSVQLNHAAVGQAWTYTPKEQMLTISIEDDGGEKILTIEPSVPNENPVRRIG